MSQIRDFKFSAFAKALRDIGFRGEIEADTALRASMSTDNSVYQIMPDLVLAPLETDDVVRMLQVMDRQEFASIALTMRGGGTGTNGQSLNRGVIVDMRRHMNRLISVDQEARWADVEPGIVLDDLNEQLRPLGLFFAPETSTSTRCTVGGMVSTDASGKGSRIYGKTSDNIEGLEIAHKFGILSSLRPPADWAGQMLAQAELAARSGRHAFIENTPKLNRRFTGYDLERACPPGGGFEWWRLFLGAEGTLGPITRIRVRLRRIEHEKRLIVVGFDSFRAALAAANPLLADDPTAIEVMDEQVQQLALHSGLLAGLPEALRPTGDARVAYVFIEFNGDDAALLQTRLDACRKRLRALSGVSAVHVARDRAEIGRLWAVRSAGVGLLGKVDGAARPVAFVEDCVVPPENLPAFLDEFLSTLAAHGLGFGIYGHVDVGCLHIRPALNIDTQEDRERLVAVSDAVFALTEKYGGIFWGEHGKGLRGAYLKDWIGPEAYAALQRIKAAFDPAERYNPGKLVVTAAPLMAIATTPFRAFNSDAGDRLEKAFRCNGNAQCLSYAASAPMCPSFKATNDVRHSPKGRADALRAWRTSQSRGEQAMDEGDLLAVLDTCLGCKACASDCPVQVDIPQMRSAFYAEHYARHRRRLQDQLVLMAERLSPMQLRLLPLLRPFWPLFRRLGEAALEAQDLPNSLAGRLPRRVRLAKNRLGAPLPERSVLIWQDWFTALFDPQVQDDALRGLRALGYRPLFAPMLPAGKAAMNLGDMIGFERMAETLAAALRRAAESGVPMIGLDPAYVMMLRQEYPKAGVDVPTLLLPQEFLVREIRSGRRLPKAATGRTPRLFSHCTEITALPDAASLWAEVFDAIGLSLDTPSTGCCGMAGLFGHQVRHQPISRKLFEMSWRPKMQRGTPALATGFSCRCQAERLGGTALQHPLGYIASAYES